jgi:hypothetical protein
MLGLYVEVLVFCRAIDRDRATVLRVCACGGRISLIVFSYYRLESGPAICVELCRREKQAGGTYVQHKD